MNHEKEGLSFHRTFPLSRNTLYQVLQIAVDHGKISRELLKGTTLGSRQIESAPNYATATGLFDQSRNLTPFGTVVYHQDPTLSKTDTQWLLHYYLSAPHGNAPIYWNYLVVNVLNKVADIYRKDLVTTMNQFMNDTAVQSHQNISDDESTRPTSKYSQGTLSKAASVFCTTYSKPEGLGALGLLRGASGKYQVHQPEEPSPRVVAYALADFWEHAWGETNTVNLARITDNDGPARLFMLGAGAVNRILNTLQAQGVLEVHRGVPPYQVSRGWSRASDLLETLYEE